MQRLLEAVEFRNPSRAREDIARLGGGIPERIMARIQSLLASVPDPDEALHFLERLRQDCPAAFNRIASSPAVLRSLITAFSYSRFLSEAVLQRPEWLLQAADPGDLHRMLAAEEFTERLQQFRAAEGADQPAPVVLARFRRRQSLRILLRDVLGLAALADITGELSNLADAILDFAYRQIRGQLTARYGEPLFEAPDGQHRACGFAVIALGKLGGQELNYSSDVDLMFVYSANGETPGPGAISNKEFFKKVANQYTELLSTYTADGSCYRVDLRLRPDGRLGEVCTSLDGAKAPSPRYAAPSRGEPPSSSPTLSAVWKPGAPAPCQCLPAGPAIPTATCTPANWLYIARRRLSPTTALSSSARSKRRA